MNNFIQILFFNHDGHFVNIVFRKVFVYTFFDQVTSLV